MKYFSFIFYHLEIGDKRNIFKLTYCTDSNFNLERTAIIHQGWAKWSEWGPCSNLCGDGISSQLRRCLDVRCMGPNHRRRICNMQQCDNSTVRVNEAHCSTLDSFSYNNSSNSKMVSEKWIPTKSDAQCVLMCRSLKTGEVKELKKMTDGSVCSIDGYDKSVCVNGICQYVGCDGIVQSNARYDQCGICGGTGENCKHTIFQWKNTKQFSPCDATCGPKSYRVSISICENIRSGRVVPERLCAGQQRPRPVVEKCPHIICSSQ
ncbi:unnamed protein product [Litomosoides sigmodontis]|uniref:ADAMTS/ADAMTS-like cysteine-rich domain-containing protein n=1 Tax=Litomosoides sigmodontis TaxID=42156 RepID=A0A3P6TYF8_LITSI|nr:unnamed protein product [Litomosoides sigmodontis]